MERFALHFIPERSFSWPVRFSLLRSYVIVHDSFERGEGHGAVAQDHVVELLEVELAAEGFLGLVAQREYLQLAYFLA